jgi:hypothetical protein
LRSKPCDLAAFNEVCGSLELTNGLYDHLLEDFHFRRGISARRVFLRANLVSSSVKSDRSLSVAAESGSRVRLWTYYLHEGKFDVLPYCRAAPAALRERAGTLGRLLARLSNPGGTPSRDLETGIATSLRSR